MRSRTALAFSPAVISNFFSIQDESLAADPPDYSRAGATGGGFTLSKGVYTTASITRPRRQRISVVVNGDRRYPARTTTAAVELLLDAAGEKSVSVRLEQKVEVPIGSGFGSSAASALSACNAVAAALDVRLSREEVASFAHKADIVCKTGLGTVSSSYDHTGAGIITRPGGPGVAEVRQVTAPRGLRIVTATAAPVSKSRLLVSRAARKRIDRFGDEALRECEDLSFESLLSAGESFARRLGLAGGTVKVMMTMAKNNGAVSASQNMVGQAIHAVVPEDRVERVERALSSLVPVPRIDRFRIGGRRARVLEVDV